jgi:hypothetical protein
MQEAVFLFHVFFEICALKSLDKKCGRVDKLMRILKRITSVMSSSKSVNCVKEAVFLLHVFFLSFKILKKLWTGGQVMKIEKKFVSASCIFLFISVGYVDKFHYLKLCFLFNIFLSFLYP